MRSTVKKKANIHVWFGIIFLCLLVSGTSSCKKEEANGTETVDSYYRNSVDCFFFHPEFSKINMFHDDVVAEFGPVGSIEEITSIPERGWNERLATREGYGYVIYNEQENRHSRVYIVEKTEESTIAQCQTPFIP